MRRVTHMDESCHIYKWVMSHIHRETMGLEGGVSSLVDEGQNFEGGLVKFWGWWNLSEHFQISPPNIWGGDFTSYEQNPPHKWQLARKMRRAQLSQISAGTCSTMYPWWAPVASFASFYNLIVLLCLSLQLLRRYGGTALFKSMGNSLVQGKLWDHPTKMSQKRPKFGGGVILWYK